MIGTECPECGFRFSGRGFTGIDSHWKMKHADKIPYSIAWPLIKNGRYKMTSNANSAGIKIWNDEPSRIERLERVASSLREKRVASGVMALFDYKGILNVDWSRRPLCTDLAIVIAAWLEENEVLSNHFVRGYPYVWDQFVGNRFGGPRPELNERLDYLTHTSN